MISPILLIQLFPVISFRFLFPILVTGTMSSLALVMKTSSASRSSLSVKKPSIQGTPMVLRSSSIKVLLVPGRQPVLREGV